MKRFLFYISQDYSFAMLRPLQEILLNRGDKVSWFFEGNNVTHRYVKPTETLIKTVSDIFSYQPDVVLATANSIPSFLPGLKATVFHGFDAGKLDNKGNNDHFKIRGCFDLYCTQGPSTTVKFKALQQQYGFFNVIETGWPALDTLFIHANQKSANSKPTIFLCSTFSKRLTQAKFIFPQVKKLCETMDWQWIVSFHPKLDQSVKDLYRSIEGDKLRYVTTDDLLPYLQKADILVGDTSSILTMFIVQNKPVVTINNIDPKPYFINITEAEQLKEAIVRGLSYPTDVMNEISNYTAEVHPYTDGKSASRVIAAVDDMLQGKHSVETSKPLNLIKNLKFRKRLNYWRF